MSHRMQNTYVHLLKKMCPSLVTVNVVIRNFEKQKSAGSPE